MNLAEIHERTHPGTPESPDFLHPLAVIHSRGQDQQTGDVAEKEKDGNDQTPHACFKFAGSPDDISGLPSKVEYQVLNDQGFQFHTIKTPARVGGMQLF